MSRRSILASVVLVAVLLATGAAFLWKRAEDERRAAAARERMEAQQARDARRASRDRERIAEESDVLLPNALSGVALAATREEVEAARPGVIPSPRATDPDRSWYQESLENGAKVLYAFDDASERLVEVQVLGVVPPDGQALRRHLQGLGARLGAPNGVFDCDGGTSSAPTRQIVWTRRHVGLRNVLLAYGDRLSVTQTLMPLAQMEVSMRAAGCRPVGKEGAASLPTASPEHIARAQDRASSPRAGRPQRPPPRAELPAAYR